MKKQKGQALITLLVFTVIASIIIAAAVAVSIINTQTTSNFASSEITLKAAEAGTENAILRILRNPNYTGETLTVGDETVTITVTGTTSKTIVSQGADTDFLRTIQADGTFTSNVFTLNTWNEI